MATAAAGTAPPEVDPLRVLQSKRNLKHGLYSQPERYGLTIGAVPEKYRTALRVLTKMRRELEAAVVQAHGRISLPHAAAIVSACRAERVAQLCTRFLTEQFDTLDLDHRVMLLEKIAKYSMERDKCIDRLSIDPAATSAWDRLHHVLDAPTAPNATAGQPEALERTSTDEA